MNYIAHLHLAYLSNTSLLGNFLGDFIRGSDLSYLPDEIAEGVKLHRKIDTFTDQYSDVSQLKALFTGSTRRLASASLDVYFDHLLIKQLPKHELNDCLELFYRQLEKTTLTINPRFQRVRTSLLEHRWLVDYQQQETVLQVLLTIEQRLRQRVVFAAESFAIMQYRHAQIEKAFLRFYPDLVKFTQELVQSDQ